MAWRSILSALFLCALLPQLSIAFLSTSICGKRTPVSALIPLNQDVCRSRVCPSLSPLCAAQEGAEVEPATGAGQGEVTAAAVEPEAEIVAPKREFKGFGKPRPKEAPKESKGKKSPATKALAPIPEEWKEAANKYDDMAKRGIPEYAVYIRKKGGTDKEWFPVGGLCVPRTDSVDDYIYSTETQLKEGAFRLAPMLKGAEEYEYGYHLRMFPDEPIRVAEKRKQQPNFIANLLTRFMSPIDTSGAQK